MTTTLLLKYPVINVYFMVGFLVKSHSIIPILNQSIVNPIVIWSVTINIDNTIDRVEEFM